jgi:hypothetical protein
MQGEPMLHTRAGYRAIRLLLWVLTGWGVVEFVTQLAHAADARFGTATTLRVVHIVITQWSLIVLPLLANLVTLPTTHRFRMRLEAAWRGDDAQVPLADHQPVADATALSLPVTIRLRPRWFMVVSLDVLVLLAIGLFGLAYILVYGPTSLRAATMVVWLGLVAILSFVSIPFLRASQRMDTHGVTVSDEGMTMHLPNMPPQTYAIKWDEARLFAIVGRKRRPGAAVYMLAAPGRGKSVKWVRVCRPPRWFSIREPTVPFAEYDRQMQALLSLIVARTGLPLRDLR